MATFAIGRIDVFDNTESWTCYKERLDQYFLANEVDDAKKVPALLALIGPTTYQVLRDLTAPDLPKDKSFKSLCDQLANHFNPKPLTIAERFRFHKRDQKPGESVSDFNLSLRKFAEHCNFGVNLNNTLRDRFVCGLKTEAIQKKLLTESDLTYDKAVKIALAMESASKDVQELHSKSEPVHKLEQKHSKDKKYKNKKSQRKNQSSSNKKEKCIHCHKKNHTSHECHFKDATCFSCKAKGHIAPACPRKQRVHQIDESDNDCEDLYSLQSEKQNRDVIYVTPTINNKKVKMELDTGSGVSVMSKDDFDRLYPRKTLKPTSIGLKTYSGERIEPIGVMTSKVQLNGQTKVLDLYIVNKGSRPLFGREWLNSLKLNWSSIKALKVMSAENQVKSLKDKYASVFSKELGTVKGVKAHLKLKENAQPKFVKARSVPFVMKDKIEKELTRLEADGVLEKVSHSNWATPIVPVPKAKSDDIRICGDFKVTVNPVLEVEQYPLPKIEEIFASLGKGKRFTKIDLKNAYLQIEVDDESKELLTISTHRGLFRYKRLVFGIASAPAIFQRTIEQILIDIPGVRVILDDMIITGDTDESHLQNLEKVLQKLHEANVRVNPDKCEFFKTRIQFCGYEVDENGLHKTEEKIKAILNAPKIENVHQLRSFLGLVQYYARFLENLSTVLHPLYQLLKKNQKWNWTAECDKAVDEVKGMITSDLVLMNYDPTLPIILACDASTHGMGAVLSHKLGNGVEKPIAFASRTLNSAEKNYSQIDKEATALVWGVKKFHTYLYGNKFTLITDHKPLLSIFSPKKGLSATTGARLQRYALFLAGYTYDIQFKNTKLHGNCDSLSRLPLRETEINTLDATEEYINSLMETLPVTVTQVANATRSDTVMSKLYEVILNGWTEMNQTGEELKPYLNRFTELSLHQGCILWGSRVIIPKVLQRKVLEELHEGHVGTVKMKSLARGYVWWPQIDSDIENITRSCSGCMSNKQNPPESPIHPWEFPKKPWSRVHIDFAGPFMGYMYLVLVDAYSKWPIVKIMKSTTATNTVEVMRAIFADFGLCDEIVSDNGPQFVSEEFGHFLKMNGVKHIRSSPYHPRTNGLAERFVQTLKQALKAAKRDNGTIQTKVAKFLIQYRNAEHSTTKESPAKLFLNGSLVTRLDKVKPSLQKRVETEQSKMKRSDSDREFKIGQSVAVRDYRQNTDKWTSGKVTEKLGPVTYRIEISPNMVWKRHSDQMIASNENVPQVPRGIPLVEAPVYPESGPPVYPVSEPTKLDDNTRSGDETQTPPKPTDDAERQSNRRYPLRIRKKPNRFDC